MAEAATTTNVVPITSAPRLQARLFRATNPEPLVRSPELAVIVAILYALPPKQRAGVKAALFRKALENPGDDNLARAYEHVGRVL